MQPERVEQFPNLKWLRSTSVNPRAEHAKFYDRVWAKDDPFWNTNSPGTEWNCKCDIEETDEPVWDNSDLELPEPVPGLEGNPAKTGEVFTDNAGYVKDIDASGRGAAEEIVQRVLRWHDDYMQYRQNPDYTEVKYDYNSGGMMAVHKGHQMHAGENEKRYFGNLTSGELEMECGRILMRAGNKVEYVNEMLSRVNPSTGLVEILPCLDIRLNDVPMDIRSVTADGKIETHLSYKNKQLGRVEKKTGVKSNSLCLFYHIPEYFSEDKMSVAIERYKNFKKEDGTPITKRIQRVYVVRNGYEEILEFDVE
ncbi:MAG: hypothetical protein IJT12_04965 [Paludibacteraceae bacterium]|nr:hypothetical protein [Paludibacteraceae bacterium]